MRKEQPALKVEYARTDSLVPYANNAKIHEESQIEQIANSIEEFGFNDPIGVWTNKEGQTEIIEGHGRVLAAKRLGIEQVPVVYLDHLSDAARRAYTHVHNQLTLVSDLDMDIIESEIAELPEFDWDALGFDGLLDGDIPSSEDIEEDEIPEKAPARTQRGQVWKLGQHRLMCGDSTSAEDMEKLCASVQASLMITDPPYNVALGQEKGHKLRPSEAKQLHRRTDGLVIDNDYFASDEDFVDFLASSIANALAHTAPGGVFYVWHASSQSLNFWHGMEKAGAEVRQTLIWAKNTFALGRQDYQWRHEPCFYGWKAGAGHEWYSDRKQSTVLEYDKPTRSEDHPTMKPVALIAYLMENSSRPGDTVLDPFGGSGTTLIAAEQLNRRCLMMELDEHYCDVIIQRWENLTGETAELA